MRANRKPIEKFRSESNLEEDYKFRAFEEANQDVSQQIIAACLYSQYLKGRKPEYIRKMFDDIIAVLSMPPVMGKTLEGTELMKTLEDKCGIDFNRVDVKHETQDEWRKRFKE